MNAFASKVVMLLPAAKVTLIKLVQPLNAPLLIAVKFEGRVTLIKPVQSWNPPLPTALTPLLLKVLPERSRLTRLALLS